MLEKQLQQLLLNDSQLDLIADQIIKKYSVEKINAEDLQSISVFLYNCGYYSSLTEFLTKLLEQDVTLPWGHFAAALLHAARDIPDNIKAALIEGAEKQNQLSELSRCHDLDIFEPELIEQRRTRRQKALTKYKNRKAEALREIETFKSQGLIQQEAELLEKLQSQYPQDVEIESLISNFRERKALGLLHKDQSIKQAWVPIDIYEPKDPEIEKLLSQITSSMNLALKKDPALIEDFVVAQMIWENYTAALSMIDSCPQLTTSLLWLRTECQLKSRKYLELVSSLEDLEKIFADDPEATFAVLYYRAQALWGLGSRYNAIEILESIATTRPSYRATSMLLTEWRGEV